MATVLNKPLAPPDAKPRAPRPVVYPEGDGKPMAETELHRRLLAYGTEALDAYFVQTRPDTCVSGNNFIYYRENDARARVSPDCYVVFGAGRRVRPSFKVWEENGLTLDVVIEFTSKKTKNEDQTDKRDLYQNVLRATEYLQFDPTGDYLRPRLQGLTLVNGRYESMPLTGGDRIYSPQLGLFLVIENEWLRFLDPRTNTPLLSHGELSVKAREEAARAQAAEDEVARLRAELDALRRGGADD